MGELMSRPLSFFDTDDRLRALSEAGDPLERLSTVIDFELFRPELEAVLARPGPSQGLAFEGLFGRFDIGFATQVLDLVRRRRVWRAAQRKIPAPDRSGSSKLTTSSRGRQIFFARRLAAFSCTDRGPSLLRAT